VKNIILGAGEVANAIIHHLKNPTIYDKGEWETLPQMEDVEILHIAIPYTDQFSSIVADSINIFNPMHIVIHSTVKPGTCNNLGAAYSPVLGRHANNFKKDVLRYKKMYSGKQSTFDALKKASKFKLEYISDNTEELEFAKIMSTGAMYWYLIFEKSIFKECSERGYKFNNVYKRFTKIYNDGVKKDWQKPIYTHDDNPIPGGHCLDSNIYLDDNFINDILKEWQKKKGELHLISV
jgi:hypothetical protein